MTLLEIFLLYLAFRLKQLTCDFFLQTTWMALGKGKPFNQGGAKALFCHAGVHAAFTLAVVLVFAPQFWWLAPADFVIHAAVDRARAAIESRYRWTYSDQAYWWCFGIDQEAHNITHLFYIVLIVLGLR